MEVFTKIYNEKEIKNRRSEIIVKCKKNGQEKEIIIYIWSKRFDIVAFSLC